MVAVSEFEGRLREANVGPSLVLACYFCIVYDVGCQAVPLEGAEFLASAIASFAVGCLVNFQGLLIMSFYDAGDVWHAAVADLQRVPVKDSAQF